MLWILKGAETMTSTTATGTDTTSMRYYDDRIQAWVWIPDSVRHTPDAIAHFLGLSVIIDSPAHLRNEERRQMPECVR